VLDYSESGAWVDVWELTLATNSKEQRFLVVPGRKPITHVGWDQLRGQVRERSRWDARLEAGMWQQKKPALSLSWAPHFP
jgi:hypothetical protein